MRLPWRRAAVATVLATALIGWAGAGVASADSHWHSITPTDSQWHGTTPADSHWHSITPTDSHWH